MIQCKKIETNIQNTAEKNDFYVTGQNFIATNCIVTTCPSLSESESALFAKCPYTHKEFVLVTGALKHAVYT